MVFFVICTDDVTYPRYDKDKPGIYCTIGTDVSAVVVKELTCNRPDVSKGMVNYPKIELSIIQDSVMFVGSGENLSARYVVTKLPLMPSIQQANLSLFPSCQPHNGYVWVGAFKETGSYDFNVLCYRSIAANIYRNHYPINRLAFWTIDSLMSFFHFSNVLLLPRLSMAKVEKEDKIFDFEEDNLDKKEAFASQSFFVDVSSFERDSADHLAYKVGDLMNILDTLRRSVGSDDDFRAFLFAQRDRMDNGNPLNHFLTKLFVSYDWQDLYGFAKLGTNFEDDYKKYMSSKGSYIPPDPKIPVPPVADVPVENDSDSDDGMGDLELGGDFQ